jgi:hypothetical protein
MRIPKLNAGSYKNTVSSSITEVIDIDLLERVKYDSDINPEDQKTFPKVVKTIKTLCRMSNEYKNLMSFLKEHYDFSTSFLYKGIKRTQEKKFSIEVHHSGMTIEDIVATVIHKRMANGESLTYLDICHEIMWLHYKGLVDLTPLDKTTHALIHSPDAPDVFLPLQFCPFGNSGLFYTEYKKYIPENVKVAYNYLQDLSMKYDKLSDALPKYLQVKKLYYEGFIKVKKFEEMLDEVKLIKIS